MEIGKLIRKAMIDKGISGKMELVEKSGISYAIVTKIITNDGSAKLSAVNELLDFLGYKLKAEVK